MNGEAGFLSETLKKELKRKAFHFLSLLYAAGYFFLERGLILKILTAVLVLESFIEFGRFLFPGLNGRIVGLFGGIHREEEIHKATGIFWTLSGSLLTMAIFQDRRVVLCSMGYLIFADAAAALIGVKFGSHRFLKNKSVEGSLAFFFTSLAVGLFFMSPPSALLGAAVATLIELLPLSYNDNFWIPVISASFLTIIPK
jgi:dolichol kinase